MNGKIEMLRPLYCDISQLMSAELLDVFLACLEANRGPLTMENICNYLDDDDPLYDEACVLRMRLGDDVLFRQRRR
jgi:hypothetical protein